MPICTGVELNPSALFCVLALCCTALAAQAGPVLKERSNFIWSRPDAWFGGFSGAEVSSYGNEIALVGDRGRVVTANIERENGAITGINIIWSVALRGRDGSVLRDKQTDAEGLAISDNGRAFVSLEHSHRVVSLDIRTGRTRPMKPHKDFRRFQINAGLEALMLHPDGTLFTLPEESETPTRAFPLYALRDGNWQVSARIPRRGPFLPVGGDFDESGQLYLLERTVTPLGFRSRIRRFDFARNGLVEQTLLRTLPGRFDNLEALSVWQDAKGQTQLTLVSDDNFLPIQRTQIVEFAVTE